MEEWIGGVWDRLIKRAAQRRYPLAMVTLETVRPTLAPYFRALGGAPSASIKGADTRLWQGRRRWLEKVAGTATHTCDASLDADALYLPPQLDVLPTAADNHALYFWLTALAAHADPAAPLPADTAGWLAHNHRQTAQVLARLPGLATRYATLVTAHLACRPDPRTLPAAEAALEQAIRQALTQPHAALPPFPQTMPRHPPEPVPLWLIARAAPPLATRAASTPAEPSPEGESTPADQDRVRRKAERVTEPEGKSGMMMVFRAESIFSWAEYLNINRPTEEDEAPQPEAAKDLDVMAIAQGGKAPKKRLRFDLDLPPESDDDTPIGSGIRYPEWEGQKQRYQADYARIVPLIADEAPPTELPVALQPLVAQLKRQFAALTPLRHWQYGQPEGEEIDLDRLIRLHAARRAGTLAGSEGLYRQQRACQRSLATLVLADMSLSTDAYVNNDKRVIDVVREALMVFAEAMSATRDAVGLYGFSSVRRENVRFHLLKDFSQPWNAAARGRIAAIKPGFYTRMGAAIRHATTILMEQPAERRLLLLVTDGKPNDLDRYEGHYGIEDTRMAIVEARAKGLIPFCVTVDREGGSYLPHLFGAHGFVLVRDATRLPQRLAKLYLQLAR